MDNSTIIEGTVKFRDGKKWKSRWCVMRKLSPVADCLHLQLYRDSKERYKQGHTKASLSLQHFLAIETGFTLDKESNTIAIICQDVTVILAFDTRERQMQWQVKISNNLGEDVQFLIQITSAPPRAKIAAGPARLHVKEQRFCLTSGVPPRLLGFWDISQLRRYGVVEGRFVFEGGSRCGKGEGVHVCVTDQGDEITRTFQMAAQGKVAVRRRPVTRNMSMMDSPRRQMLPRTSEVSSVLATPALSDLCSDDLCRLHRDGSSPYWLSTESSGGARNSDLDSNYGCGDTSSVSEHYDQSAMSGGGGWHGSSGPGGALERCVSCMSKLGALSRSSTAGTCTPLTPGPPGAGTGTAACWLHDAQQTPTGQHPQGRDARSSAASLASSHGSDGSRCAQETPCFWYDRPRLGTPPPVLPPKSPARAAAPTAPSPCRPPKPAVTPQRKPPPPLPLPLALPLGRPAACQNPACACACTRFAAAAYRHLAAADAATSPYDNYDVPKPILGHLAVKDQMSNMRPTGQNDVPDGYYDTPRSLREHLTTPVIDAQSPYGNYDVPASVRPVQRPCGCAMKYPRTPTSASADTPAERHSCPCQRMMGWAENLMTLPYCKRGNGVENTTMPITKVRLSGEGKMPVVSPNGDIAIYNPSDSVKKFVRNDSAPSLPNQFHRDGSTYGLSEERSSIAAGVTLEVSKVNSLDRNMKPKFRDYANLAFSESLEYYENARDVLNRAGMAQQATESVDRDASTSVPQERVNVCDKCRHTCHNTEGRSPGQSDEAVVLAEEGSHAESEKQDADYVSMQSVVKSLYRDTESNSCDNTRSEEHLAAVVAENEHEMSGVSLVKAGSPLGSRQTEKSASSPNLEEAKSLLEVADILKRHAPLDELDSSSQLEDSRKQQFANRKRSSSADASRFIDDVEDEPSSLDGPVSLPQAGSCDSVIHSQVMVADNVEPVSSNTTDVQQETHPHVSEPSTVIPTLHTTEARIACMRRSSSVPSHRAASAVSGNNRDSSSSNDSGVSIASLRHRGGDFAEFELPLTTSMSARRHHMAMRNSGSQQHHHHHSPVSSGVSGGGRGSPCLHSSLPRRSKSVDPLRDITFQFTEVSDDSQQQQAKCSSAEAEVPVCPKRRGFQSPGGDSAIVVPYPDSRSTSSGTSDMSDYIETLSLSSHGSSDVPDSMRFGRLAVTTLKPRSGNEYQLIDRSALEGGPNVK